jgi:hypothetical protein
LGYQNEYDYKIEFKEEIGKTLFRPGILKQRETCAKVMPRRRKVSKKPCGARGIRTHDSN